MSCSSEKELAEMEEEKKKQESAEKQLSEARAQMLFIGLAYAATIGGVANNAPPAHPRTSFSEDLRLCALLKVLYCTDLYSMLYCTVSFSAFCVRRYSASMPLIGALLKED